MEQTRFRTQEQVEEHSVVQQVRFMVDKIHLAIAKLETSQKPHRPSPGLALHSMYSRVYGYSYIGRKSNGYGCMNSKVLSIYRAAFKEKLISRFNGLSKHDLYELLYLCDEVYKKIVPYNTNQFTLSEYRKNLKADIQLIGDIRKVVQQRINSLEIAPSIGESNGNVSTFIRKVLFALQTFLFVHKK